jgi:hypothetical protein
LSGRASTKQKSEAGERGQFLQHRGEARATSSFGQWVLSSPLLVFQVFYPFLIPLVRMPPYERTGCRFRRHSGSLS